MSNNIKESFRKEMESESTEYLKRIWDVHNTNAWTEEQFEVIAGILRSRGADIPIPKSILLQNILISSTHILQDRKIKRYLGIVSSEVVIGTGFLSEIRGSVADFFGARAGGFQNKLQESREYAIAEISEQAIEKGGNAIIGVEFDYMTLSENLLMVSANGTAVEIELEQAVTPNS